MLNLRKKIALNRVVSTVIVLTCILLPIAGGLNSASVYAADKTVAAAVTDADETADDATIDITAAQNTARESTAALAPLDYDDAANWVYCPEEKEHDVDVFFLAPCSSKGLDENTGVITYNMEFTNESNVKGFVGAINMEKGIYDDKADFYAPLYRQIPLEGYELPEAVREIYLEAAYADVAAAFDYYLENLNGGRPFLLAGFSQGSDMMKRLLKSRTDWNGLIAAYMIGWNLTEEEVTAYPQLKPAAGAADTGVIISFNTEDARMDTSIIVPTRTLGINPLTWTTDTETADKSLNKGACFTNYDGEITREVPALTGCYLDGMRGTLKPTDVTPEEYPAHLSFLRDGCYHIYDYQFFYRNLEENVQLRIDAYDPDAAHYSLAAETTPFSIFIGRLARIFLRLIGK